MGIWFRACKRAPADRQTGPRQIAQAPGPFPKLAQIPFSPRVSSSPGRKGLNAATRKPQTTTALHRSGNRWGQSCVAANHSKESAPMDKREILRAMRLSDREKARIAARIMRYEAECRTIDEIVDGAKGG